MELFSLAASLAASSPNEATSSLCRIQGWHAPKLAGHRGDAVAARSNASMVGQGNHPGTMVDGGHDRCFKFWLGRLVGTIRPLRPAQRQGTRPLATNRRGNEWQCSKALQCKSDRQSSPAMASRLSSARQDRQQGNLGVYQPSVWSLPVLKQQCSGPLVDVLPGTDPPCCGPPTKESDCSSRPTVSLEARPHGRPA